MAEVDGLVNLEPASGYVANETVGLVRRLGEDESGATAVEYSLILGGIAAAIIVMIYVFGGKVNNLYGNTQSRWP